MVRMEQKLRLLRPPYSKERCPWISDSDMNQLLANGNFQPVSAMPPFPDWQALIVYLRNAFVEAAKKFLQDQPEQNQDASIRLLQRAPADKIEDFLQRIQNELLPKKRFLQAQAIMIAMLHSPAMGKNRQMYLETLKILTLCNEELQKQKNERQNVLPGMKHRTSQEKDVLHSKAGKGQVFSPA
ncbi:MAG: hypothetical protein HQL65_00845 [Magnetococcales bacterium]|nr:hypothetical protein [Magnetococcales bacterium]